MICGRVKRAGHNPGMLIREKPYYPTDCARGYEVIPSLGIESVGSEEYTRSVTIYKS